VCGRYTQTHPPEAVVRRFLLDLADLPPLPPRYNIAPAQAVLAVVAEGGGRRRPLLARWGLVPAWARQGSPAPINARAETAHRSPLFRQALRRRRALVVADGFFEWRRRPDGRKTPVRFTLADGGLFAFAGLWEPPADPEAGELPTCCILTTRPNALVAAVHDRMPVILRPEHEALWLDPGVTDPAALAVALQPYPAEAMAAYPVSPRVNSPRHDDPGCIRPAEA
jgi:putative SOS response-associated peptidase YedK